MEPIELSSIKQFKILPFDLYDSKGNRLFNAGEVITPGKLMQILKYNQLFIESFNPEEKEDAQQTDSEIHDLSVNPPTVATVQSQEIIPQPIFQQSTQEYDDEEYEDDDDEYEDDDEEYEEDDDEYQDEEEYQESQVQPKELDYHQEIQQLSKQVAENSDAEYDFSYKNSNEKVNIYDVVKDKQFEKITDAPQIENTLASEPAVYHHLFKQEDDFKGVKINNQSVIPPIVQKNIKEACEQIVETFLQNDSKALSENTNLFLLARDTIVDEVVPLLKNLTYRSELKILGEYDKTHGLNTAILSVALASKLGHSDYELREIALAALLHDIGKTRIRPEIVKKTVLTPKESKIIQTHAQIGYKILTRELNLPKNIALVALEHHEKNDGSGYPYRLSIEQVSYYSQLVSVCNTYDNLVSHKGHVRVESPKEAIKVMLETGSRWFNVEILYKFVHMANYNDNVPL